LVAPRGRAALCPQTPGQRDDSITLLGGVAHGALDRGGAQAERSFALLKPRLKRLRQRRPKGHGATARRVLNSKLGRVEEQARRGRAAIPNIARDRGPRFGELNANLMRPARLRAQLNKGATPAALQSPRTRHGLLTASRARR
jgi:hypothetical protein